MLITVLSLTGLPPHLAWAQGGIAVTASPPPDYKFGETLIFQISARSRAPITEVRVFYRAAEGARTIVGDARFTTGAEITATYSIDLTTRPLPPFTTLEYWWEIRDSDGSTLATQIRTFYYEDNRFDWQSLSHDPVTVRWYEGDRAFGQTALDVAVAALAQANRDIQAPRLDKVNIYLYRDEQDLRAALKRVGRAWVGGHADPTLGVVMVPTAPGLEANTDLERLIPHEVTHLLVYKAVGDATAYARVPSWLNEGLAVMNQVQPDPDLPAVLAKARDTGTLLGLSSLCGPFPDEPAQAQLAYAESESVVRYLRDRYGSKALRALLAAYADGAGCEAGVQRELGLPLAELESDWLRAVVKANPTTLKLRALAPWLFIAALVLVSPLIFFLLTRRKPLPVSS